MSSDGKDLSRVEHCVSGETLQFRYKQRVAPHTAGLPIRPLTGEGETVDMEIADGDVIADETADGDEQFEI
eukprot:6490241-Amphidinium_carterae.1